MNKHEIRNKITDPKTRYSLVNLTVSACYSALPSEILCKTSRTIFDGILSNKIYYKKGVNDNNAESRRIYNKKRLNPEDIIKEIKPQKSQNSKILTNEIGNLSKYINKIHEQNIFYIWKMGHPYTYMYFMERDPAVWTVFNPKAKVPPKTIKKLANIAFDATKAMQNLLKHNPRKITKKEINNSYAQFLEELILKMPDSCKDQMPRIKDKEFGSFSAYLRAVQEAARQMDDFEGLEVDESFILNVPESFRIKYLGAINESDMENFKEDKKEMDVLERQKLEDLLIPKNKNLVSDDIGKSIKQKKKKSLNAKKKSFAKEFKPFENCNDMIRFYRATYRQVHAGATFDTFDSERIYAQKLMDKLILNNRKGDKKFLKNWIRYYAQKQTAGRSKKVDVTSMKAFASTINEYNDKYLG